MDLSLSSVLMSTDVGMERVGIVAEEGADTGLSRADLAVAYSHPVSTRLGIPSIKRYRRYSHLVGRLHATGVNTVSMEQLIRESGLSAAEWEYSLGELGSNMHVARRLFERNGDMIQARIDVRESWTKVVRFFETVCSRMFQGRGSEASEALLYRVSTPDGDRVRWMSPDDISFLVAVGLRALVEECWSQGISLVGIVKDSSSRYFSRHYYGVMRHLGVYPNIRVPTLPWTDKHCLKA